MATMKKITAQEAIKAAVNSPDLATSKVKLGDREFPVVDLSYDDYLRFIAHLTPLLEVGFSTIASAAGLRTMETTSVISASTILQYAGDSLPELACIVCNQTDPSVTTADVKLWAQKSTPKGPFKLAEVVLKQIEQNNIINDFASFFEQMLPLMKTALNRNK